MTGVPCFPICKGVGPPLCEACRKEGKCLIAPAAPAQDVACNCPVSQGMIGNHSEWCAHERDKFLRSSPAAPGEDVGEDRARFEAVMREKYGPSAWTSHVSWWIWCAARNEAAAELTRLRAAKPVPREPTKAMLAAAEALPEVAIVNDVLLLHQVRTGRQLRGLEKRLDVSIWQAMYDAAREGKR